MDSIPMTWNLSFYIPAQNKSSIEMYLRSASWELFSFYFLTKTWNISLHMNNMTNFKRAQFTQKKVSHLHNLWFLYFLENQFYPIPSWKLSFNSLLCEFYPTQWYLYAYCTTVNYTISLSRTIKEKRLNATKQRQEIWYSYNSHIFCLKTQIHSLWQAVPE